MIGAFEIMLAQSGRAALLRYRVVLFRVLFSLANTAHVERRDRAIIGQGPLLCSSTVRTVTLFLVRDQAYEYCMQTAYGGPVK